MPSNIIFVPIMVHQLFQELTIFYFTTLTVHCVSMPRHWQNLLYSQKTYLGKGLSNPGLDVVGRGAECFTTLGHEASSKVS